MAISGIGYGNMAINNPYQRNKTVSSAEAAKTYESYMSEIGSIAQNPATVYESNPINPLSVDPRNATWEEMKALNNYLVGLGYLKTEDINSFERPTQDDSKKADYYNSLREWRDTQYQAGNMVGYKNAAKVCDAWLNAIDDLEGNAQYIDDYRVYHMEGMLTSGILGFGSLEDGAHFEAGYADDSTSENPIIQVKVTAQNGTEMVVKVKVNQVDSTNATQLEMFALLTHQDAQGMAGSAEKMASFRELLYRAENSDKGDMSAKNAQDFMFWRQNWHDMTLDESLMQEGMTVKKLWGERSDSGVPYYYLAKDGVIEYNGVTFVCDEKHKALCLGDTSNPDKCLTIPLSGGGSLIVNRDNLGDLAKAIGMFSPEDVRRILEAIAQDAKVQEMQNEIEEETSGIELAEDTDAEETAEESGQSGMGVESVLAAAVNETVEEKEEEKKKNKEDAEKDKISEAGTKKEDYK